MRGIGRPLAASLAVAASLALAPAANAAVAAHWAMDETAGTTAFDDSGNGFNGALTNVTLGLPGATGLSGDTAFGFNGQTSKMIVPKVAGLAAGTADVTVTMHVQTTHRPGIGKFDFDLFSKGGYQIEIYPRNGKAQARCKFIGTAKNAKIVLQDGPDLIDGQWHTITCHKEATKVSLTVDGTTFTQSGTVGELKAGGKTFIGVGSDGTDLYNGALDDVSVQIG
jgi:hypothetical protein